MKNCEPALFRSCDRAIESASLLCLFLLNSALTVHPGPPVPHLPLFVMLFVLGFASLYHKAGDDPMENKLIVKAAFLPIL
jgi:hypothetical protein